VTLADRRFDRSLEYLARARRVVPGASQTLSKGPGMFVEGAYPVFLQRGRGCRVWDVDGNEYVDYVMGLASVTLGYSYPPIDQAVARQLERGSIFSLPAPAEVEVSERLTRIIPCAEMARFLKTGSEANSAVVRVARAATGRDVIVFCGYSGWHDWYAVTTPRSKGIPKDFARYVVPFTYNDLSSLEAALEEHRGSVAAVLMEPVLLEAPRPGFLAGVKDMAHRHGALLIFDEIVSGFRWAAGGAQEYFGVVPDLAVFGKGMANGLPLAAVVGRRELMREFEEIFVSSTFGGDTLALAACLRDRRATRAAGAMHRLSRPSEDRRRSREAREPAAADEPVSSGDRTARRDFPLRRLQHVLLSLGGGRRRNALGLRRRAAGARRRAGRWADRRAPSR